MLLSVLRIVLGFVLACLAAGLVQALFVITPVEIAGDFGERIGAAGMLALIAATQAALFSIPFAALAIAIVECQGIRAPLAYAAVGAAIGASGFLVQAAGEAGGVTILNTYALAAYLAAGVAGGLVYWAVSGRRAGRRGAAPATA